MTMARKGLVFVRLAFFACVGGALLAPPVRVPTDRAFVVAAVDGSASQGEVDRAWSRQAVRALRAAARGAGADLQILRFAARPALDLENAQPLDAEERAATNLELAIDAALAQVPPGRRGRIVLVSDGRETVGAARAAAARARARQIPIFHLASPATPAAEPGIALLGLEAPTGVAPGQTFSLSVHLSAAQATRVRLGLWRDGAPEPLLPEREVVLPAGDTWLDWPSRLEELAPAFYRVELLDPDPPPGAKTPQAVAVALAERRPKVHIVEAVPNSTQALAAALRVGGMEVERLRRFLPGSLAGIDLLVLSDPPPHALSLAAVRAISAHVRDAGGGLLLTGGPQGLGAGGYPGPLGELLPVAGFPAEQKTSATLALALVIDRSGSMSGPKLELTKEAARAAALRLHPDDHLAVIAFDNLPRTIVRMQPAFNRQRILADISRLHAGGGTNVAPALREALDQLLAVPARKKHMIVLSDGQSPAEGIDRLVAEAAAGRITVSAVAVGDGADLALLESIARRGGGRFHQTRDPDGIPRIFTEETTTLTTLARVERSTRAVARTPARMTAGIALERAPPLAGYARTRAKPGAEILLATSEGEPLLSRWQQGLGKVAVFSSDVTPAWAASWLSWSGFPKLFGQIARGLLRQAPADTLELDGAFESDRLVLSVAIPAADARTSEIDGGLSASATVLAMGAAEPLTVPLSAGAPGRFEARVEIGQAPAVFVTTTVTPGGRGAEPRVARAGFSRGLPPEERPTPTRADGGRLLADLARETGGAQIGIDAPPKGASGVLSIPATGRGGAGQTVPAAATDSWKVLLGPAPGGHRPVRPGPFLVVVALALFLVEIAVSRANFRAPAKERQRSGAGRKTRD